MHCAREARILALMFSLSVIASTPAVAATLLPGQTLLVPGELGPTGGTLEPGTGLPVPFAAATFSGTLTSSVISGDPSNPYGGLTFTYLLSNSALSPNYIARITVDGYAGFLTDGSYQVTSPGVPPTLIDRSSGSGDVIGFTFINPLPVGIGSGVLNPGFSSTLLVVHTNATNFTTTMASIIDGSVTSALTFRPVPEPSALALLGIGSIAISALRLLAPRKRISSSAK